MNPSAVFDRSCFLFLTTVFKVVHSGYLGSFVQAWDSFEGRRCCGDGHQIPQSVYDQPSQGETVMSVLPLIRCIEAKQGVTKSIVFLSRLDFHLELITQVASTPVWTLTATRTSIHFSIVSIMDSALLHLISEHFILSLHVFNGVCSCLTAFRAQQGEVVRSACRIVPLEAFQIAAEWLPYQIASPIDTGDTTCKCLFSFLTHWFSIRQGDW